MSLPVLADLDQFEARLLREHQGLGDRRAGALSLLAHASTFVRGFTGRSWVEPADPQQLLQFPAATHDLIWDLLAVCTIEPAARVWTNPTGVIQRTTGPFSYRYSDAVADGLRITADERTMLARVMSLASPGPTSRRAGRSIQLVAGLGWP